MARPCENCPYRKDAPRRLWHRTEFEKVLMSEVDEFGKIFNCHKQQELPAAERGFCAGWLLDQKKRGVPSIALRMELITAPDAGPAFDKVHAKGLKLFKDVETMCKANGIGQKTIVRLSRKTCYVCKKRKLSKEESRHGAVCARCRSAARVKARCAKRDK
jgi:hypothetical protein